MKSRRMRKLAVVLALACAHSELLLGPSLVASALILGVYATHGHQHSVVVQFDRDHLDVVLSHGGNGAHRHGESSEHTDHGTSVSQGDHVVHITAADVASGTARRAVVDSPVLAISVALAPVGVAPVWPPSRSVEPRARGVDQLRTVVLRI